jgi:hypothetical protein
LFQLLQVPFAWVWGPAFWYGRLLSLASALLAALLIGLVVLTLTGEWLAALSAGLMLLAFPYLLQGSTCARAETLALALSWAGLFAVLRWPARRSGVALAVVLFTASLFTNLSYGLVGPGTALAWLLQRKGYRQALQFTAWLVGVCLALFLGVNFATRGGFFFNLVTANVSEISSVSLMAHLTGLLTHGWILLLGAAGFLVVERWWYPTCSWPLVMPYVLLAGAKTLLAGPVSAGVYPLYEIAAALCLVAGAVLAWPRHNYLLKSAVMILLALQVSWFVDWFRQEYIPSVMAKAGAVSEIERLAQMVRQAEGPVLADEYLGLLPLAERPVYFQPVEFSRLQSAGLWDPTPLVAAIQRREFSAILLYEPPTGPALIVARWTPEIRNAIWANYKLKDTLAGTWIYTPKE